MRNPSPGFDSFPTLRPKRLLSRVTSMSQVASTKFFEGRSQDPKKTMSLKREGHPSDTSDAFKKQIIFVTDVKVRANLQRLPTIASNLCPAIMRPPFD
jgi:hypothetical protein